MFSEKYPIYIFVCQAILNSFKGAKKKSYILSFCMKFRSVFVFLMNFIWVLCYKAGLTHFYIIIRCLLL